MTANNMTASALRASSLMETSPRMHALVYLGTPPRHGSLFAVPALALLEVRRLLRSWRWWGSILMFAGAAYALNQRQGFGAAAPARFPGGELGLSVTMCLLAITAVFMAVESAGIDRRRTASAFTDSRPLHPVTLSVARWLAVFCVVGVPAAIPAAWPFLAAAVWGEEFPLVAPAVLAGLLSAGPLAAAAVGAGLLGRSCGGGDASGFLVGAALSAPAVAFAILVGRPAEVYLTSSDLLGVLKPLAVMAWDAGLLASYGFCLALAAGLVVRRRRESTALRSLSPPKRSWSPAALAIVRTPAAIVRGFTPGSALGALLFLVAALPAGQMTADAAAAWMRRDAGWNSINWESLREPAGVQDGVLPAAPITGRGIVLNGLGGPIDLTLSLKAQAPTPVAGITFGPNLEPRLADDAGGRIAIERSAKPQLWIVRFDPPLAAGEELQADMTLTPDRWGWRDYAQTTHPVYATWSGLGAWYGDGVEVNFRERTARPAGLETPYVVEAPAIEGRRWVLAAAERSEEGGRVRLTAADGGLPGSLTLSRLVEVADATSGLNVRFFVFPDREPLADALHIAWRSRFLRIARLFGENLPEVAFVETPFASGPATGQRIPSSTLDELQEALPLYEDWRRPTAGQFDRAFRAIHESAVRRVVSASFAEFEEADLLRDALIRYVDDVALQQGQTRGLINTRTEWTIVPWDWANRDAELAYPVREADAAGWQGPAIRELREPSAPALADGRLEAFHHLLRYRLGDEAWCAMWEGLFAARGGEELRLQDLRQAAEEAAGESLDALFDEWLVEGVLPEYAIRELQVTQRVDPETSAATYTTTVGVENRGSGSIPVECVLTLDGDRVVERVPLGPGESRTLTFETDRRPLVFEIDPLGWIPQRIRFDPSRNRPIRNELFVKAIRTE